MTSTRQRMDVAYDEWELRLKDAPTRNYLYALLKESDKDKRLSLVQRRLLREVYQAVIQARGWRWEA